MMLNRIALYFARFLRAIALALVITALGAFAGGLWVAQEVRHDLEATLPSVESLPRAGHAPITKVLSRDGRLVATLFEKNSRPIPYRAMGDQIVNAVTAIEDERFYEHSGVDYKGIARAAYDNYQSGSIQQGASTITMQLARHLYLSDERSYERKAKEALLALKIEKEFTKRQILERYLNEVYFGAGAHGIAAAANRYFRKEAKDLSPAEAAMLAGLIQSPSRLNPITNHAAAKARQKQVLRKMYELGHLDTPQYAQALRQAASLSFDGLDPQAGQPMLKYPYFTTYAIHELAKTVGEDNLYNAGLTVRTTLDLDAQRKMEKILAQQIEHYGGKVNVNTGAAVLIHNESGEIRAMVGGTEWSNGSQFNRAWQALRQPGSSFKPFLYAAALEQGATQDKLVDDKEIAIELDGQDKVWKPVNSDWSERGRLPLREALQLSRNQATVDLLTETGLSPLLMFAEKAGVDGELPRVPSLALGSGAVSPLDMAEGYSVFARGGVHQDPISYTSVKDAEGRVVARGTNRWTEMATTPEVASTMTDMLMRVVREGTGRAAHIPGLQTAGKTGTTDSFKDAWFVGFSPKYTLAVWIGNDDNSPTWRVYGGELPAQTWRKIMISLDHGQEKTFDFLLDKPARQKYCKNTHRLATDACKKTYSETFYVTPPATDECEQCPKRMKKLKMQRQSESDTPEIPIEEILPTVKTQDFDPGQDVFDQARTYPKA